MLGECVVKINDILVEDRTYLYEGLTLTEAKSVKLWETAGSKIYEAALNADQIQQLFQQVEKNATAAGGNRTAIGKGKDVATAVNTAWEDLKTKVQNSGPISNIDQKYDQAAQKLKQATGGDAGVMKYVQKYRDFAKKHPIAQGLIYSALIAAAGISGAGVGGAAALGLLKMTDKLLQGEKFSSAAYAGAKTGALAYGASHLAQYFKNPDANVPPKTEVKMPDGTDYIVKKGDTLSQIAQKNGVSVDDLMKANSGQSIDLSGPTADPAFTQVDTMGNYTGMATDPANIATRTNLTNPDVLKPGQNIFVPTSAGPTPTYQGGVGTAADTWDKIKSGQYSPSQISTNQAAKYNLPGAVANPGVATNAATGATNGGYNAVQNAATQAAINAQSNPEWDDEASRRIAGAGNLGGALSPRAQFPTGLNPALGRGPEYGLRESRYVDRKLTVYTWALNESVGRSRGGVQLTNEGVMDAIKGAASKAGQWAQTKGKNLTTKVTADKLQSAWKKAGSPTDSEDVAKVLKDAGVPDDMVKQVYTDMKVPLPGSPKEAPPVNSTTGAPQSTPAPDPEVTGPAPEPTPSSPADNATKPDYSGGQKTVTPTVNSTQSDQTATTKPDQTQATTEPAQNAQPAQNNTQQNTQQNTQAAQPKQSLWNRLKAGAKNLVPGGASINKDQNNIANDALPVWRKFLQQYLAGYGDAPENITAAAKAFAAKNYPEAGKAEIESEIKTVSDAKTADAYILKIANRALANYKAGIDPNGATNAGQQAANNGQQTQASGVKTAPDGTQTTNGGIIVPNKVGGGARKDLGKHSDGDDIQPGDKFDQGTGAPLDVQQQALAQGVTIKNQEPIIISTGKGKEYGLDDNGQWIHLASGKVQPETLQAFLSQQHDISLGV